MNTFWIGSIALLVIAAMFLLLPIIKLRKRDQFLSVNAQEERIRENVSIYKERLADLENELSRGNCTQEEFNELEKELKLSLLADAMPEKPKFFAKSNDFSASVPRSAAFVCFLFFIFVSVVSYKLYFDLGSYEKVAQREAMSFNQEELDQAKRLAEKGDMQALLEKLYGKLQNAPDNVEGWMLLSRTAMNLGDYTLAIEGYEQVISNLERTQKDSSSIYGLLAQAFYFQDQADAQGMSSEQRHVQEISGAAKRAIDAAFARNPEEVNALGLLAIHAFDQEDYAGAVEYWKRILNVAPDHPARASIESGIARANELLGDESEPSSDIAKIIVNVSLSEELQAQVSPQDSLFIFARSSAGPPMPLAASRHVVAELPLTIVLDDSKAMTPMAKLSQAEQVRVVARISKSGEPIAKPGDLEGEKENVSVNGMQNISLVIDQVL